MRSPTAVSLSVGALLGFTGVALGAFGAHALKGTLAATGGTENWKTAVFYQLVHAVALVAVSAREAAGQRQAGQWWIAGIVLFSGSLYLLALGAPAKFLWPVTPAGGICLLTGWAHLLWRSMRAAPGA